MGEALRNEEIDIRPIHEIRPGKTPDIGADAIRLRKQLGIPVNFPRSEDSIEREPSINKARSQVNLAAESVKAEKVLVFDLAFTKGEKVNYQDKNGNTETCFVEGSSEDAPPGLLLKNEKGRHFAIGAKAVKDRVTKIEQAVVTEQNLATARAAFDKMLKQITLDEDYRKTLTKDLNLSLYHNLAKKEYTGEREILKVVVANTLEELESKLTTQGFKMMPDGSLRYKKGIFEFGNKRKDSAEKGVDYEQYLALKGLQESDALSINVAHPSKVIHKATRELNDEIRSNARIG